MAMLSSSNPVRPHDSGISIEASRIETVTSSNLRWSDPVRNHPLQPLGCAAVDKLAGRARDPTRFREAGSCRPLSSSPRSRVRRRPPSIGPTPRASRAQWRAAQPRRPAMSLPMPGSPEIRNSRPRPAIASSRLDKSSTISRLRPTKLRLVESWTVTSVLNRTTPLGAWKRPETARHSRVVSLVTRRQILGTGGALEPLICIALCG
jgi:hypothetical protein